MEPSWAAELKKASKAVTQGLYVRGPTTSIRSMQDAGLGTGHTLMGPAAAHSAMNRQAGSQSPYCFRFRS